VSRAGPVELRPTDSDLLIARAAARMATPERQRALRLATLLADEKAVLAVAAAVRLASRYSRRGQDREDANRMICSVLVAGAVPHLFKYLVRRRRPDHSLGHKNGIARSGDVWDSFPSGHAVHPLGYPACAPIAPAVCLACGLVVGCNKNSCLGALSKRCDRRTANWRSDR